MAQTTINFPVTNITRFAKQVAIVDLDLQIAGEWNFTMDYTIRGQTFSVLGSPFTMVVRPGEMDLDEVEVDFEGAIVAGDTFKVSMITKDVYGNLNPQKGGPEDMRIKFDESTFARPFDQGQNNELVSERVLTTSGSIYFYILTKFGTEVRGSPFMTIVQPAEASASTSFWSTNVELADGVVDSATAEDFTITVSVKDAYGNNQGKASPTLTIAGVSTAVDGAHKSSKPPHLFTIKLPEGLESDVTITVEVNEEQIGDVLTFKVAPSTNFVLVGSLGAGGFILVIILAFLGKLYRQWKLNKMMVMRVQSMHEKLKRQKHTEEELEVMRKAMEDLDQKRSDELKNVLIYSTDIEMKGILGQGAFGTVSLGIHKGEKVAVKHLNTVDQESVERFRFECFLMKELRHPNIVRLVGVCWDEMLLGCILEFVSGGSLEDVLEKDWKTPLEEKRTWKGCYLKFAQMTASAMRYLHHSRYFDEHEGEWKNCIIHRDLKPDNMLVTVNDVLKLTDFGEARAEELNMTMTSVGTPIYISPEVMANDRYDSKADVYSFAVVLVAMIRADKNIIELHFNSLMRHMKRSTRQGMGITTLNRKMNRGWRPPLPVEFYPKMKKLIVECWSQNPSDRPDFDDIEKKLNGEIALQVMASDEPVFGSGKVADLDEEFEDFKALSGRDSSRWGAGSSRRGADADGDTDDEIEMITMREKDALEKLRASEVKIAMLEELLEKTRREADLGITKPQKKVDIVMHPEHTYAHAKPKEL